MLALDRHRKLLDLINRDGSVRTVTVAQILGVTEETVRRDFEKLENDGALLRSHGGAVRLETERQEFPMRERAKQNAREKRLIASQALRLIEPGQTIFCDPSTTVQQLVALIPDQPLTILTNSLKIPVLLSDKPSIQVILLGGTFRANSLSCTGLAAEITADLFRIDAAFISCRGIDAHNGLSEATEEQGRVKRHIVAKSAALYLLADATKANVTSSFFFAKNSDIDLWITDREPDQPFKEALDSQGVRVEIAGS